MQESHAVHLLGACSGRGMISWDRLWAAVSWIRRREALNRMPKPWEETPEQFATRLKGMAQDINQTFNVEGLCRAFPQRLRKLVERDGDRISH